MFFNQVVFFGSIETAKNCLKIILKNLKIKKIIVVTETKKKKYFYVRKYAKKKNLFFTSYKNFKKIFKKYKKFDLGISIRYNNIFEQKIINKFKFGIINLHGGNLPYYRGTSNHIFAIINQEKKFGNSLHYINQKIDSGRILETKLFNISKKETGYSLLKKTFINGETLLNSFTKKLNKAKKFPKGRKNFYYKKGKNYKLSELKILKKNFILNKKHKNFNLIKRALFHPNKSYGI